jgi:hypothetical protein
MAVAEDPQQQLAWEARQRPRAALAAFVAAVMIFSSDAYTQLVSRDAPRSPFLGALQEAVKPGPVASQPSASIPFFQWYDDHAVALVAAAVASALGLVALGYMLAFLAAATRARLERLPRFAAPLVLIGAVLMGVARVLGSVAFADSVSSFLAGPRTVEEAKHISSGSLLLASQLIGQAGALALAAGFVIVSLNAMRAGLITRFLGVLGIIAGVLVVMPLLPVVQPFWLLMTGLVIVGRWPGGMPPAWRTGRAEPWPSAQQMSQARREEAAARRGEPAEEPTEEPAEPQAAAGPGPQKRKRKRRK